VHVPTEAEKRTQQGRDLLSRKKYKRAIQAFREATRLQSDFAPSWNDLGVAYFESGKPRAAIHPLRMALEVDPGFADAALNLVHVFNSIGQPVEAAPALLLVQSVTPNNSEVNRHLETLAPVMEAARAAEALTHKGRQYVEENRTELALKAFVEAAQLYPGCVAAWNDLGVSLYRIEQVEAAMEAFSQALKLDPGFVDSAVNLANAYINHGYHTRALCPLEGVLNVDPDNNEAKHLLEELREEIRRSHQVENHVLKGREFAGKGELNNAIAEYQSALDLDTSCIYAWNDLGVALWSSRQAQNSIHALSEALRLEPGYPDAALNLAMIYCNLDLHDKAIPVLLDALEQYPNHEELQEAAAELEPNRLLERQLSRLIQEGRALMESEHIERGIKKFLAATELDPSCAPAWNDLGVALVMAKQPMRGIKSFERALRASPSFVEPALNLATIYADMNQHESGITVLKLVIEASDGEANSEILEALASLTQEHSLASTP